MNSDPDLTDRKFGALLTSTMLDTRSRQRQKPRNVKTGRRRRRHLSIWRPNESEEAPLLNFANESVAAADAVVALLREIYARGRGACSGHRMLRPGILGTLSKLRCKLRMGSTLNKGCTLAW